VWGYPIVPTVFVIGALVLIVNTLNERPGESLAGLGLLVIGLPAYKYWKSPTVRQSGNRVVGNG
jgi:hypothetical protein